MNSCSDSSRLSFAVKLNLMEEEIKIKRKPIIQTEQLLLSNSSPWRIANKVTGDMVIPMKTSKYTNKQRKQPKSQPIHFQMKRSDSEIQLQEDILAAEYRDYCMVRRMQGKHTPRKDDTTPRKSILHRNHDIESIDVRGRNEKESTRNLEFTSYISLLHAFEKTCFETQTWSEDWSTGVSLPRSFAVTNIDVHHVGCAIDNESEIFDLEL
jgi:hypothetical protein